jgi:hypothetical protein
VTTPPSDIDLELVRTYSAEVPLADLVDGKNTIEVELLDGGDQIANIDLTVER